MILPGITARMEQSSEFAGRWIDAGEVRPLAKIAAKPRQRQIGFLASAAVLPSHDVFDVHAARVKFLRQAAVFAPLARSLAHESLERALHVLQGSASSVR